MGRCRRSFSIIITWLLLFGFFQVSSSFSVAQAKKDSGPLAEKSSSSSLSDAEEKRLSDLEDISEDIDNEEPLDDIKRAADSGGPEKRVGFNHKIDKPEDWVLSYYPNSIERPYKWKRSHQGDAEEHLEEAGEQQGDAEEKRSPLDRINIPRPWKGAYSWKRAPLDRINMPRSWRSRAKLLYFSGKRAPLDRINLPRTWGINGKRAAPLDRINMPRQWGAGGKRGAPLDRINTPRLWGAGGKRGAPLDRINMPRQWWQGGKRAPLDRINMPRQWWQGGKRAPLDRINTPRQWGLVGKRTQLDRINQPREWGHLAN